MSEYHVERLSDENAGQWEAFNTASPEGSPFHSLRWRQISEKNSTIRTQYFLLFNNEEVIGLFPFVDHKIRYWKGLIPFSDPARLYPIQKDISDPDALPQAIRGFRDVATGHGRISYILLSLLHKETLDTITEYPQIPLNGLGDLVLDFTETQPHEIWESLSKKRRKHIQMFDKRGFEISETGSKDELALFYEYYEANIRHIGGTLRPFSYFSDIRNSMSDETRITILSKGEGSLFAGGLFTVLDRPREVAYFTYLALNRNLSNAYSPTQYLLWDAVRWAWENDYKRVCFGYQNLDEDDPRRRTKVALGARFKPIYSVQIPLTRTYTTFANFVQWRSNRHNSDSNKKCERSPSLKRIFLRRVPRME